MFCSKCGSKNDDGARFCSHCGGALGVVQSQAEAKAQTETVAPSISKPIISMIFGGLSITWSLLTVAIYSIMFAVMSAIDPETSYAGLFFSVFMSIVTIPPSIVSVSLSSSYLRNPAARRIRGLAKAGRALGIVSICLMAVSIAIAIIISL